MDPYSDIAKYFPRAEIVWQSHLHPELIDAMFSLVAPDHRQRMTDLGMPEKGDLSNVDAADHLKYKYLISADGWTASWLRVPWIMVSNSLLIKQESQKVEWFSWQMKPYVHYYPIANNISGLVEAVQYLEAH